jgi:hypothetical protein
MELKDVILSTLDEIEKDSKKEDLNLKKHIDSYKQNAATQANDQDIQPDEDELDLPPFLREPDKSVAQAKKQQPKENQNNQENQPAVQEQKQEPQKPNRDDEIKYLENMREKMLVLFEGFQSPNNKNIEAKLDLTINFLEYILSTLDERLDKLKKE